MLRIVINWQTKCSGNNTAMVLIIIYTGYSQIQTTESEGDDGQVEKVIDRLRRRRGLLCSLGGQK